MATQKLYAGVKLRETRTRLGLTQKAFAEKLGVSLPYRSPTRSAAPSRVNSDSLR